MHTLKAAVFLVLAAGLQVTRARPGHPVSAVLPDFIRAQFAGNAGMFSGGAGYSWWEGRLEPSINFGYVPAFAGGRSSMILSQKTAIAPARIPFARGYSWEPVVLGGSANVSLGRQYEVILRNSQRRYYWPDGLFFWFFIGTKAGYRSATWSYAKEVAFQLEAGSVNQYWEANQGNRSVTWKDVISLAISSQIYF